MASRIHGCLSYQYFPRNLLFFVFLQFGTGIPITNHSLVQLQARTLIIRMTHLAWEDNQHPLLPHERYGHTKREVYLKISRWHTQIYLERFRNTAYRQVQWTHMAKLGLRILDAQVLFLLSTSEGQHEIEKATNQKAKRSHPRLKQN